MAIITLASSAQLAEFGTTRVYVPGQVYRAKDATYGWVAAMYVYATAAVGVAGSPMYPEIAKFTVASNYTVNDDENGSGVGGQEICLGSWLGGVTTTVGYGFVQVAGWNLAVLTTDDGVEALDVLLPTSTDGTWTGLTLAELGTDLTADPSTVCGSCFYADGGTTLAAGKVYLKSGLLGLV